MSGSVLLHNAFIQRCTGVPFHQNGSHIYPQLGPSAATSSPAKLGQGGWHLDVLTSFQFLLAVDEVIDPINDNLDQLHLQNQTENCSNRRFSSSVNRRVGSWLVQSQQQTKLSVRWVTDITPSLAQGVWAVQSHSNSLLLFALGWDHQQHKLSNRALKLFPPNCAPTGTNQPGKSPYIKCSRGS